MPETQVEKLLDRASLTVGQGDPVDLGESTGPIAELADMLHRKNGFFAFNGGVQVFAAGPGSLCPELELQTWNELRTWKHAYEGLADHVFCFGQDIFGVQFAIIDNKQVVTFDPETAEIELIGNTIESWAEWLLADPDFHGAASFAYDFQKARGALELSQRLVPVMPFICGGSFDHSNLEVVDAIQAMHIRADIAVQTKNLPDGTDVEIVWGKRPRD
ncbi:hypothetical protein LIA77_12014 [Sarocladium implicatum]|nr:hypothetical protein LIA77_12014 [Sarocladium implicatum]